MSSVRYMAACVMFGLSASCGPDPSKNKCNSQVDCLPGYSCTNGACLTSGGGTAGGSSGGVAGGGAAGGSSGGVAGGGSAGPLLTLTGTTSFTPAGSVAAHPVPGALKVVMHDYLPAGSSCTGTIPNTATAQALTLELYNPDGGAPGTGDYPIVPQFGTSPGFSATLRNEALRPGQALIMMSFGNSGFVKLTQVTSSRVVGNFQSSVTLSDGGTGSLDGTFDTIVCN